MNAPQLFFIALWIYTLNIWAAQPQFIFNDPEGDDNGSGTLVYPQRPDYQAGDLDLRQLQISRDADGFWFAARFNHTIHDPKEVSNIVGPEPLTNFARKGFYQFNIDIYIDTDRLDGSGNTITLPGRHIKISPRFAWERAVILTPRPELMRHQLIDVLSEQFPERAAAEIEASVDQSIIFPTRIKVRGKTIEFFVPANFFNGCKGVNWAATAFVTGAVTSVSADFSLINSNQKPMKRLPLGVMQPAPGHPKDTIGFDGDTTPSPVIDLLSVSAEKQREQLVGSTGLEGVEWLIDGAVPVVTVVGAKAVQPVGEYLQPETGSAAPLPGPTAGPAPIDTDSITQSLLTNRLQSLQKLFKQGLITEEDYTQQKKRILQEL